MKVLKIKELEDCFDGSFIKEALLDTAVTKEFIFFLGKLGELAYYPDFARPFYKITVKNLYVVKGVEGNKTVRLILNKEGIEHAQRHFISNVDRFHNHH
jgi:hypothetical protein